MSNKEKYLIETFKLDESVVSKISEIGRLSGTHKYDIWIAKEVKKDNTLLNNLDGFLYIIDWAKKSRPNISGFSFENATEESKKWHESIEFDDTAKNKEELEKEDNNRILYKCRDGNHFFLLLEPEELNLEGQIMKNCVGTYTDKVKTQRSLIISLRDEKNESHVTMEIDTKTGQCIQTKGKANNEPAPKYLKLITEFAIFASGYSETMDKELLELMEMNFD